VTHNSKPRIHAVASQQRLSAAHAATTQTVIALEAALREAHAILFEKSSGRTDRERIELAEKHIRAALIRHCTYPLKPSATN